VESMRASRSRKKCLTLVFQCGGMIGTGLLRRFQGVQIQGV
jgi:hypothetical protein